MPLGETGNPPLFVPEQAITNPDYGMADLLLNLGGTDCHLFQFKKNASLMSRTGFDDGMLYVHTLTNMK